MINYVGMREILGKTRFEDVVFLFWEIRNGTKFYYDVSRFLDSERDYDVYAPFGALVSYFSQKWGSWDESRMEGISELIEQVKLRLTEKEHEKQMTFLGHKTSHAIAAYGRTLLHPAYHTR